MKSTGITCEQVKRPVVSGAESRKQEIPETNSDGEDHLTESTSFCTSGGTRLCGGATTPATRTTPITEDEESRSGKTSKMGETLSTTVALFRAVVRNFLLTALTTMGLMKKVTFVSRARDNKPTTRGQPVMYRFKESLYQCKCLLERNASNLVRVTLLTLLNSGCRAKRSLNGKPFHAEPVYDIVNAGPRHRFATPNFIAKNCLGLGYGMGHIKFQKTAKTQAGLDLSLEKCKQTVNDFRAANPRIVCCWNKFQNILTAAATEKAPDVKIRTPSGRQLCYFNPKLMAAAKNDSNQRAKVFAQFVQEQEHRSVYGGLVTENLIQSIARDLFVEGYVRLVQAGFKVRLTAHDEYVISAPKGTGIEPVQEIVHTLPEWAKELPLGTEGMVTERYTK